MGALVTRSRNPALAARAREATDRQGEVLDAVRALIAQGERASAYAVAARLGIARQVAHRHLLALERKGLLADVPRVVRGGHWAPTPAAR